MFWSINFTEKSSAARVPEKPVSVITTMLFKTGETRLGVIALTVAGEDPTFKVSGEPLYPLTVTVAVIVVLGAANLPTLHVSEVALVETMLHLVLSERDMITELPSSILLGRFEPEKVI